MREIKFRCWVENKHFPKDNFMDYNPSYTSFGECEEIELNNLLNKGLKKLHDWDVIVIMQYTGLKDKNGKEIYEGDIVKRFEEDENPEQVIWNDFNCRVWNERDIEVIGNIYENPELLK